MKNIKLDKECPCNDIKFKISYKIDEDMIEQKTLFCPFCAYPLDEDDSITSGEGLYGIDEDLQ